MFEDELEKLDLAGSPMELRRWHRRAKTFLFTVSGILGLVVVAIALVLLFKKN